MSSTPNNNTKTESMGWTQSLFGYLSGKKTSLVDPSTDSTPTSSKNVATKPSPKPLQNLEGFNTVHSPQQVESTAFSTGNGDTGMKSATPSLPIQKTYSVPGHAAPTSTAFPSKSPWKATSMDAANIPSFSVGNLKPHSSRAGTSRSNSRTFIVKDSSSIRPHPVERVRRRNKYNINGFKVKRSNRGKRPDFDAIDVNKLLNNARHAIEAPREKIASDKNFRTAFEKRTFRPGSRLHPSNKTRTNGRLPLEPPRGVANTKFLTNGKRRLEDEDNQKTAEDVSSRKKTRFEGNTNHAPIVNLVKTPKKDEGSRLLKRKKTPYKKTTKEEDDVDRNKSGGDEKIALLANRLLAGRKIHKIKRSTPVKLNKSETSHDETIEEFPALPSTNVISLSDFHNWSTSEQRENPNPIKSNRIIPTDYFNFDLQSMTGVFDGMSKRLPQFNQKPLFVGEKKDRTVDVDDDDDEEVTQDFKRSKTDRWECKDCGGRTNDNEETRCQHMITDEKGVRRKCNATRKSEQVNLGWGNTFSHLNVGKKKCEKCYVLNDINAKICASCEAPLDSPNDTAEKQDSSTNPANSKELDGSIGKQGFSFGGGNTATSNPTESKGSIGSQGFSFGGVGAVTAAAAGNISSTGFSFGSSAGTTPAPSSSSNKAATSGFKFGATTTLASNGTNAGAGFQFGAQTKVSSPSVTTTSAASGATSASGFSFGNAEKLKAPSSVAKGVPKNSGSPGAFKFGAPAVKEPSAASEIGNATASSVFKFSASSKSKSPSVSSSALASSKTASKPVAFGASAPAPAPSPKIVEKTTAPAPKLPTDAKNSGANLFGNFATSSTSGSSPTQTPTFSFGAKNDVSSSSKQVSRSSTFKNRSEEAPTDEPDSKQKLAVTDSKSSFSFSSSTDKNNNQGTPAFSFGSNSTDASTTINTTTQGFSFGGKSATGPAESTTMPKFSTAKDAGSSTGTSTGAMPSLGSIATEGSDDVISKKKRRSRDDSNEASSIPTNKLFGAKGSSEASTTTAQSGVQAGAPAPFVFGKSTTNLSKENNASMSAPGFGSASNNAQSASGTPASAPSFGSTPAPGVAFGAAPAPAVASTPSAPAFTFGSTPTPAPAPTPTVPSFTFGSTPAPAPAPNPSVPFTFGSTPAPAPAPNQSAPFTFGSAPAPAPNAPTFGSTTTAPTAAMTFGSTPAPGSNSGFGTATSAPFGSSAPMQFGSSTPAAAPIPFGSAPAAPAQPFGNTFNNTATTFGSAQPTAGAAPMPFGGSAPQPQNPATGGFGSSGFGQQPTQQPSTTPNAGFSLGTGGGGPRGRTPGRGRRVIRARRPGPR